MAAWNGSVEDLSHTSAQFGEVEWFLQHGLGVACQVLVGVARHKDRFYSRTASAYFFDDRVSANSGHQHIGEHQVDDSAVFHRNSDCFRAVGRLKGAAVPAYAELGGRLAWAVSDHLTLSVTGANLLHDRHVEYAGGDAISRKVLAGLEWRP